MAKPQKDAEHPLVAQALDKSVKNEELMEAIKQLSPEEAAYFLNRFEAAFRKRKIQLTGYLVSMFAWIVGMVGALIISANIDGFTGWLFLVPFALVGACLYGFGRWAEKVGRAAGLEGKIAK